MVDFTISGTNCPLFRIRLYRRFYKSPRFCEWGKLPTPGWYLMVGPFILNVNDLRG